MKIAIIDPIGNAGGGNRFLRALIPAIQSLHPEYKLHYFINPTSLKQEHSLHEFLGIQIHNLKSVSLQNIAFFGVKATGKFLGAFQRRYLSSIPMLPTRLSGAIHKEIEKIAPRFDLLFFPWPYHIQCPNVKCPMVGTFHDFNFRYYFSGQQWLPWTLEFLHRETPRWLAKTHPIVSTHFMQQELEKFYPEFTGKSTVIPISPMSALSTLSQERAESIVHSLGIQKPYLLYPTNLSAHKNIGPLLAATHLLNARGWNIPLIIAGYDTHLLRGKACPFGLEQGHPHPDVIGLGYVDNEQIDALIQCASAVVSTSLYEAGCGPGLDAWHKGVPVAMSNIPPFVEHLDRQNVRAELFDPRSPEDIAHKIETILKNPAQARENALASQKAISHFTWAKTAQQYCQVFEEVLG